MMCAIVPASMAQFTRTPRAAKSCRIGLMVFGPSRPSVGSARTKEGRNPARSIRLRTRPPGRWSNAHRGTASVPLSRPLTHASRLVAQSPRWLRSGWAQNPGGRASSSATPMTKATLSTAGASSSDQGGGELSEVLKRRVKGYAALGQTSDVELLLGWFPGANGRFGWYRRDERGPRGFLGPTVRF